ncbi:hypothetical protein F0L68_05595 [Solihabitans fulvus]|uniref:Excreted virulence factor EspC, type VII ESX diderm n=1 Tax=Solihabitans fulvus TaxID=1892852 RepID=A0A5B2XNU2_9PSEU|nr:type VII secretion target [Solihabitans fulvus]KAA2264581.1 hypothetical protein F0L68_05595 [Solihabitans fulvus]
MNGPGFGVDPTVLDSFAGELDKRAAEVHGAADKVGAANGFDFQAFGAVMGQVLAVPSRIALKVVQDKVSGVAGSMDEAAKLTRDTAAHYRETDANNSSKFGG